MTTLEDNTLNNYIKSMLRALAIFVIILFAYPLEAQNLELIKTIVIRDELKGVSPIQTEVFGASRKKIGKYACINLEPLINKAIASIPKAEYPGLILIIRNQENEYVTATIGDFISKNVGIAPRLCIKTSDLHIGDTVRIFDKGVKDGGIDTKLMDEEVSKYSKSTLYINLMVSEFDTAREILPSYTIFFATDQTTYRWLKNAVKIEIYKLK